MPGICVISVALVTSLFHGQKWQWCMMYKLGAGKLWLDFGMLEEVADVFHRDRCNIYWAVGKIHSPKYSWTRKASPWFHPSYNKAETNGIICCKRSQKREPRCRCPDCIGGPCAVRVLEQQWLVDLTLWTTHCIMLLCL